MKFVIAPDKFKGSLTAQEFCNAVEEGLQLVFSDSVTIIKKPLADGGDGTLEIIDHYLQAERILVAVHDPFFRPICASYLFSKTTKVAFIEMSEASGLKLLNTKELNCKDTTTLGTGELIAHALDNGAEEIILGIGGSASNDGGMGMAHALGYRFLDVNKKVLKPIGNNLNLVHKINDSEIHQQIAKVKFKVACDVVNPFYGPNGAAQIYAAQKGASTEEIEELDKGLKHFASAIQQQYTIDLQNIAGSGAAGGLGGGAYSFLNANLISGIELVKELAGFDATIQDADWIITGEGKLDAQTLAGKTIAGVVEAAAKYEIPVAALCGSIELTSEQINQLGLSYAAPILENITDLQLAFQQSYENLVAATVGFAKTLAK